VRTSIVAFTDSCSASDGPNQPTIISAWVHAA
jgi:hypothetical protein